MPGTTKILLYQGALRILGQRRLATITEATEPRYLLDGVWDEGAVDACLEEGQWNFALRTIQLNYDPSITSTFGYQYAFSKPTDWIRTAGMGSDPYLQARLRDEQCKDESGYWYADVTPLYVRYVSNDNSYGNNLSRWPQSFCNFVEAYLALKISPNIMKAQNDRAEVLKVFESSLLKARSKDAMNEGSPSFPEGRWTSARRGRRGGHWDRGSRSSLIG